MNDIDALYAAICAQPCEDAPRLMYADALDERGQPGDADRATFIRKSIELSLLGSPRQTVENAILKECGENYYELFANEMDIDGDFEVGMRIDLNGEEIDHIKPGSKNKFYHGLLITKVIPDDDDTGSMTLALKRDEYSVPFPKKKHAELTKWCFDSARKNWKDWIKDWDAAAAGKGKVRATTHNGKFAILNLGAQTTAGVHYPSWTFDRGFVSRVMLSWDHWAENAGLIVKLCPISHVELLDAPDWDYDSKGVTIAGQLLPWSYAISPDYGESHAEWLEDHLPLFLSLRWPTIPKENWTLPQD